MNKPTYTALVITNVIHQKYKMAASWPFWIGSTPKLNLFFP